MSRRIERVNELLRKELAMLISQASSGDLPMVSVDAVRSTPDLKSAKVFVRAVSDPAQATAVIEFLEIKRNEFQVALARAGNLKFTPVLDFRLSRFGETSKRVDEIINRIHQNK